MENFIEDTEEQQLVDLFDEEVDYAEHKAREHQRQLLQKRPHPSLSSNNDKSDEVHQEPQKKRLKIFNAKEFQQQHDHMYLQNLPLADMYERSYMHKENICNVIVSNKYEYIFTMSVDGFLKFWKKIQGGIEFVKTFRAHLGKITGCSLSSNETRLATVSGKDCSLKMFDVVNFDLMHMIKLKFIPDCCEFINKKTSYSSIIAIAEYNVPKIYVVKAETAEGQVIKVIKDIHYSPIRSMKFCHDLDIVISTDENGIIEYWDPETYGKLQSILKIMLEFPNDNKNIKFELVSDTDLLELVKQKTCALSLALSSDEQRIAIYCKNRQIKVFEIGSGKLILTIDESLNKYIEDQSSNKSKLELLYLDKLDFERRLAVEKDIDKQWEYKARDHTNQLSVLPSIYFDETDTFLYFGSLMGIKIFNVKSQKLARIVGKVENTERFLQIGCYQGKPTRMMNIVGQVNSGYGGKSAQEKEKDPTFVCSAFKKNRFYLFTQREPEDVETQPQTSAQQSLPNQGMNQGRDVFNEKVGKDAIDEANAAGSSRGGSKQLPEKVIIYTSFGELHCQLYPNQCPKTIENFTQLAKTGYYNNVIFHRVIKSFMLQTGDPDGDGTGGESIWGYEFEDEICEELNHSQPFMLSMANHGPNTNGSQFFITVVPCPWLDGKHTVFGRVTRGMDIAQQIEQTRTDDKDKPLMDIKIQTVKVFDPTHPLNDAQK